MKTKEEIEQLAELYTQDGIYLSESEKQQTEIAYMTGYTQCQEDMADDSIRFADWLVGDINGNGATKQQLQDNTTTDLYNIFLNKQD
jgi:hypothetical protein